MPRKQVLILIESCSQCPFCGAADKGYYCHNLKNYITPIDGNIPDNCPQPDINGIEKKLMEKLE